MIVEVANKTDIPVDDILGNSRKRPVVIARHAYWYLLWENANYTTTQIAQLNDVNYGRVRYGINIFRDALDFGHEEVTKVWNLIKDIQN